MKKMTYSECEKLILDIPKFTKKNTFEQTKDFYEFLGRPGEKSKIIHVAGTNGKGSVCSYLESIIIEHGYSCGLFTSPHLVSMCERARCNRENISESDFTDSYEYVIRKCKEYSNSYMPSFFELIFFMSMIWFEKKAPDYLILETGLGGRLDTTNVVSNKMLCIITKIALDHMEYLGDTVEKIASEKAGIIMPGTPLLYYASDDIVVKCLEKRCKDVNVSSYSIMQKVCDNVKSDGESIDFSYNFQYYGNGNVKLHTSAIYQAVNASMAIKASEIIFADNFDKGHALDGLSKTYWPCRMEYITKDVLIDGAHNPDGVKALIKSLEVIKRKKGLLFSVVADKDYEEMVKLISDSRQFETVVISCVGGKRQTNASYIRQLFLKYSDILDDNIVVCENVQDAFYRARENNEGRLLVIAGSLYLAGDIRRICKEETSD